MNIAALSFIVIMIITLNTSSSNLVWNCNHPLLSNYLYITLAFVASWFFSTIMPATVNVAAYIASVIGIFILLFVIITMPARYFVAKHLVWFAYLAALTYIFIPSIAGSQNVMTTAFITAVLFLVMSFIANVFRDKISTGWGKYLQMALIGLILVMIVAIFLPQNNNFMRTISYITVGLFSLFILVDTKRLLMDNCSNPDYINSSMNLFLDTLNIFSAVNTLNK
jgi:FtsH-binding integral membrane protein